VVAVVAIFVFVTHGHLNPFLAAPLIGLIAVFLWFPPIEAVVRNFREGSRGQPRS
jgi:H+/gluconate symporter-like permease